jgi:hypothetical protein
LIFDRTLIALQISHHEVVTLNHKRAISFLDELAQMKGAAKSRVHLIFDGFDDVPEEIYEIEPIRTWMRTFADLVPHFLYFIGDQLGDNHVVLLASICTVRPRFQVSHDGEERKYMILEIDPDLKQKLEAGLRHFDPSGVSDKLALLNRCTVTKK